MSRGGEVEAHDLMFNPRAWLRLRFTRPSLETGLGVCHLALHHDFESLRMPSDTIVLLAGELRSDLDGGRGWLGFLRADHDLRVSEEARGWPVRLGVSLDAGQLMALEQARAGRDLCLLVDLRATLLGVFMNQSRDSQITTVQYGITINRDTWARLLEQFGAAVNVPILVPLPLGDPRSRIARAGQHLHAAQRAITDSRYNEAVQIARLAVDILKELDQEPVPRDLPRQQRNLPQRFAALRDELFSLASGASHDDPVTKDFQYTRADATAIVGTAAGLLARYSPQSRGL
jgi:hypothetical protein